MSTIGQGKMKVVRLFVTRTVKQSAEITVELEDEDYEDIKDGKLNFQTFFNKKFKDHTGYDNISWLETNAGGTCRTRGSWDISCRGVFCVISNYPLIQSV